MRVAIYARYSSENQREASLDDQIRLCRERIQAEHWHIAHVFQDRAISGSSGLRRGYQAMLAAAREGSFDVLVAEALDRLSRDQEDVAGLFKRLQFAGIRIVTLSEGEITELHVGLKGTMNALFIKDLAAKTHRGLRGRVEAGRSAGGLCYGYDVIRRSDERGEAIRGERAINEQQAATVRQIFTLFADGASPIAIAKQLNKAGDTGPQGKAWRDTTIRGHAGRGTGILRNELYVGRLVWNRMHFLKDPATGRRVSRMNPPEQWIVEEVEGLRIVDQDLWERVRARLDCIREKTGANEPDRPRYWDQRRAQHLLSSKAFCGTCGSAFTNVGRDYLACASARKQGVCDNRKGIRREALEAIILDGLRSQLMQPEHVAEFVSAFTEEWNRLQADRSANRAACSRELEAVRRKLSGLIDAISEGMRAPGLQVKLDELEQRKVTLEADLAAAPVASHRLMPNLGEVYRQKVERLQEALTGPDATAALLATRALIERVVLFPAPDAGGGLEIELVGEIAAMVRLARGSRPGSTASADDRGLFESSIKVVAGACFGRELTLPAVAC